MLTHYCATPSPRDPLINCDPPYNCKGIRAKKIQKQEDGDKKGNKII